MRFRLYQSLRVFTVVANHKSFTSAAGELHLTKGAVSYQIKQLERELGFDVFTRQHGGIALTEKGERLWYASRLAFQDLEKQIESLRGADSKRITIGTTTYFASRWLSPRLMLFLEKYPSIKLRIQPVIGVIDLRAEDVDMAIRWGKGDWSDMKTELLFRCPAIATAGASIAEQIHTVGIGNALPNVTLLHDREGSQAWLEWYEAAGLPYRPKRESLVIPDPNVRVQAVIDGQGIALNDFLVDAELSNGQLFQISPIEMKEYGYYLAYPRETLNIPALKAFRDWIIAEGEKTE